MTNNFTQFGKIYIGSNLYLDGNIIADAIGDEELGILRDITSVVTTIITSIPDVQHFVVQSTVGMSNGDTLVQGTDPTTVHQTIIVSVVDSTHLTVVSTLGFSTATTYTDLANRIIFDKNVLANTLSSFGIPSSSNEELIALVDKVAPLSINFIITPPSETFNSPVSTSIIAGSSNVITFLAFETVEMLSEMFSSCISPTVFTINGNINSGGDAIDTTRSINFVILATDDSYSPPRLSVDSTSGFQFGDTIMQGVNSTTVVNVIDSTHVSVNSITGFIPDTTIATFAG